MSVTIGMWENGTFNLRIVHSHPGLTGLCGQGRDYRKLDLAELLDVLEAEVATAYSQGVLYLHSTDDEGRPY